MVQKKTVKKRAAKKKSARPPVHDPVKQENVDPLEVAGTAAPYVIFLEKKIGVLLGMFSELEKNFLKGAAICERAGKAEEEIEADPEIQQFMADDDLDDDPEYE